MHAHQSTQSSTQAPTSHRNTSKKRTLQGIALFSALITAAIAASILASIYALQALNAETIQKEGVLQQLYIHQMSLEKLTARLLDESREIETIDHRDALWNYTLDFDIDQHTRVIVHIEDTERTLNYNNLIRFGTPPAIATTLPLFPATIPEEPLNDPSSEASNQRAQDPVPQSTLNLFLRTFRFFNYTAAPLLAAAIDWMDSNTRVITIEGAPGAERAYYQTRQVPYNPSGTHLNTLNELALVRGFDQKEGLNDESALAFSRRFASATPVQSRLNINTIPCDSPIFAGIFGTVPAPINFCDDPNAEKRDTPLSFLEAAALVQDRLVSGSLRGSSSQYYFTSVSAFYDFLEQYTPLPPTPFETWEDFISPSFLVVNSSHFTIESTFEHQGCIAQFTSLITRPHPRAQGEDEDRDNSESQNDMRVLQRSLEYFSCSGESLLDYLDAFKTSDET